MLNGPLETNFSAILIDIDIFSFGKIVVRILETISSRPQCVKAKSRSVSFRLNRFRRVSHGVSWFLDFKYALCIDLYASSRMHCSPNCSMVFHSLGVHLFQTRDYSLSNSINSASSFILSSLQLFCLYQTCQTIIGQLTKVLKTKLLNNNCLFT